MAPLKAFLQCMDTGRFLKDPETWVEWCEEALAFDSAVTAIEFYSAHKLRDTKRIRVILRFAGDSRFDIGLPHPNESPTNSTRSCKFWRRPASGLQQRTGSDGLAA